MRILHIIPSVSPVRGGPSKAIVSMVSALIDQGISAEVATTNDDGPGLLTVPVGKLVSYQGTPTWFFPRFSPRQTGIREFAFSYEFTNWLWKNVKNYDLLHVHAIFSYPSTAAMTIARLQKKPYLVRPLGQLNTWSLQQNALKKKIYLQLIEHKNLNSSYGLHFTSEQEKNESEILGLNPKSFIIPHGLSLPNPITNASQKLRNYLRLTENEPIIVFLSRVHPKKGLEYLIPALGKIQKKFTFVLAGNGETDYENRIKALLLESGLANKTHWTGFVEGEIKDLLLQGSDLFVLTSYSENFGIAVLEAMASDLPVLVTKGVALSSVLEKYQAGYVVNLDINAITNKVLSILNNSNEAKIKAKIAKNLVLEQYSWLSVASQIASAYQHILNTKLNL